MHNAKVRRYLLLQQKSAERREAGCFVLEGQRELQHALAAGYEIDTLFVCPSLAGSAGSPESTGDPGNPGISGKTGLSGQVVEVTPAVYERMAYRGSTEGCAAVNLIRSSVGAVFTVPCVACSSAECIAFLKDRGIQILTAQLQDSVPYYDSDMRRGTAIVMGTEATGLTTQWRLAADAHIRIPMLGRIDSLNVSVSAAILLFEAVRQRV